MQARAETGVDEGGDGVGHKVGDDDEGGRDQRDPHDDGDVGGADGVHEEGAQALHGEDAFGDDRAAQQATQVEGEVGDHRQGDVAHHVAADDAALGQADGAGGAHVVLAEVLQHLAAHHAGVDGRGDEGEDAPGQDEMPGPVQGAVGEGDVAGDRHHVEGEAEQEDAQQSHEVGG